MRSYIYPALHGACGFCYEDDSKTAGAANCELQVETLRGVLRFRLTNALFKKGVMNKFHVNVPEAEQPRSVALVCGGRVLDKKPIAPVAAKLAVTVNGARPTGS